MAKETFREVKAPEKTVTIQERPKNRDILKKKNKKRTPNTEKPCETKINFIKDLKTQLTYGDTGHGVILDKKA
jgi:hypothetical protein